MHANGRNLLILDVPYFQQTRTATCGPACLMMVMNYWDQSKGFSQRFESQLWRKSYSLLFFGGTFQYGLATAAAKLGFKTEVYQKNRFSDAYPKLPQLASLFEDIVSRKARQMHLPIHYGVDSMNVITDALSQSIPPIVFVNLQPLIGENVFHWVVVTGLDDHHVYMNDPYVPQGSAVSQKKGYPVERDIFSKAISTETGRNLRLPPCVVLVYK